MKQRLRVALIGSALTCATVLTAQTKPVLQPVDVISHFQPVEGVAENSGSLDGWESYPIAEDAGFDSTILPETRDGISMLTREVSPLRDGTLTLGFIRRMHCVSGRGSSVHARLAVPYASGTIPVTVTVYRGARKETHRVSIAAGKTLQTIELPIDPDPAIITAVAISAELPQTIAGRPERMLMAETRIHAWHVPSLEVRSPAMLWDEARSLYYVQRSIALGSTLDLQLASPAAWSLLDATGHVVAQGNSAALHHHIAEDAVPGMWQVHVTSSGGEANILLMVRGPQSSEVLFHDVPAISDKLLRDVRLRRDTLRKSAFLEGGCNIPSMSHEFLLPGLPSYFNVLLQPAELAMLDAMDFSSTGNVQSRDEAIAILREMSSWSTWLHPWFAAHGYHSYYPVGLATKYVVAAEQFMGNSFPIEDRRLLHAALVRLVVKPVYEEYVQQDRLQWNTSNWIGNTAGGALLAALDSDDPDTAGYALGLFVKERDHIREAYTADGSYGEGISYHRFDLETSALAAEASRRVLGQVIDAPMKNGDRYLSYAAYGTKGQLLDFGDSHVDVRPSNVFAYVASRYPTDAMLRFYFEALDEGSPQVLPRILWESTIPAPSSNPETEPSSMLFAHRGVAVLRDSWSPNATVIALRAGANFNHNHADQGSLLLAANGHLWIGEAGYADYYKDPFYNTFNIQAVGHNTLLVDGDEQSQALPGNAVFGTAPSMQHAFVSQSGSVLQADLASVYPGKLDGYTRSLVQGVDAPTLVIDHVSSAEAHRLTQLWHPAAAIASIDQQHGSVTLADGEDRFSFKTYATSSLVTRRIMAPYPLAAYDKAEKEPTPRPQMIEFEMEAPQRTATFITVLGSQDSVRDAQFSRSGTHWRITAKNMVAWGDDATPAITVQWPDKTLWMQTRYAQAADGTTVFTSDVPVDVQLSVDAKGNPSALDIHADAAGTLHLNGSKTLHFAAGNTTTSILCAKTIAACATQ